MKLPAINRATVILTGSAIAERALLGVATFVVTILLGRWAGQEPLGVFSLFFPMVFMAIALEESLITAPYTVFAAGQASSHERRKYLGAVLTHTGILSGVFAIGFLIAASVVRAAGLPEYVAITAVLGPVVPCVLLREFARRVVYADLHPESAVLLSGGVSILQIALMAFLYVAGELTAVTAFVAMGLSSLAGGLTWVYYNRHSIQFRKTPLAEAFYRNWTLGRWIAGAQISEIVRTQMFPWLLALVIDVKSVGVYAACAAVATLSTALQIALSNVLVPQIVDADRRGGPAAANRLTWQATGWMTAAMLGCTLVLVALSRNLIPWIYGADYVGTQHTLIILALGQLVTGASLPIARALVAFHRTDLDFVCHIAGIVANLGLGVPLVQRWGIVGAAYAGLIGASLKAGLNVWWYLQEVRVRLGDQFAPEMAPTSREEEWDLSESPIHVRKSRVEAAIAAVGPSSSWREDAS